VSIQELMILVFNKGTLNLIVVLSEGAWFEILNVS
jgi:hypothetical protein